MFAPNEACLNAAYEYDPDLLEHAMNQRVLITTPVTLLALLRTVAYNKAIGSFDVRVMPAVRKLEEMGLGNSEAATTGNCDAGARIDKRKKQRAKRKPCE